MKGYGFLSFAQKYEKQLLHTGLDAVKTVCKKVVHKGGEFVRNKIKDAVTKFNDEKLRNKNLLKKNYSTRRKI